MEKSTPLVGAHMSASGGSFQALLRGHEIGCTAIQLFTSNQKQWKGREISTEELTKWKEAQETTQIHTTISHDSYLINLGSEKKEILEKSWKSFASEIARCKLLEVTYLNFHPGVATGKDVEFCLNQIIKSLLSFAPLLENSPTTLLLETTAGQGNSVGHTFEQIAYILKEVEKTFPIGVCIDTCHIYAAGYDISSKKGVKTVLDNFEKTIGLKNLHAFHVNDSKKPLGSRRDRHAPLGEGEIGCEAFQALMEHPQTKDLPMILETPDPELYKKEIQQLKDYAKNAD